MKKVKIWEVALEAEAVWNGTRGVVRLTLKRKSSELVVGFAVSWGKLYAASPLLKTSVFFSRMPGDCGMPWIF